MTCCCGSSLLPCTSCPAGIPSTLHVTLSDTGGCACLDGLSATLTWDSINGYWSGSLSTLCNWAMPGHPYPPGPGVDFKLWCNATRPWEMDFHCNLGNYDKFATSFSCSPLSVQFDFSMTFSDSCCSGGTVRATVTL